MNVEEALAQLGGLSTVQWAYIALIVLLRLNFGMHWYVYTFVRTPIPFRCVDDVRSNFTSSGEEACQQACTEYEFDTFEGDSLKSEWSFVCQE